MNELLFRLIRFTLFAGEFAAEVRGAAFGSEDPGTEGPGWIVADVLGVAAVEVSNPVGLVVLMEGDDFAEDGHGRRFHHKGHGVHRGEDQSETMSVENRRSHSLAICEHQATVPPVCGPARKLHAGKSRTAPVGITALSFDRGA